MISHKYGNTFLRVPEALILRKRQQHRCYSCILTQNKSTIRVSCTDAFYFSPLRRLTHPTPRTQGLPSTMHTDTLGEPSDDMESTLHACLCVTPCGFVPPKIRFPTQIRNAQTIPSPISTQTDDLASFSQDLCPDNSQTSFFPSSNVNCHRVLLCRSPLVVKAASIRPQISIGDECREKSSVPPIDTQEYW